MNYEMVLCACLLISSMLNCIFAVVIAVLVYHIIETQKLIKNTNQEEVIQPSGLFYSNEKEVQLLQSEKEYQKVEDKLIVTPIIETAKSSLSQVTLQEMGRTLEDKLIDERDGNMTTNEKFSETKWEKEAIKEEDVLSKNKNETKNHLKKPRGEVKEQYDDQTCLMSKEIDDSGNVLEGSKLLVIDQTLEKEIKEKQEERTENKVKIDKGVNGKLYNKEYIPVDQPTTDSEYLEEELEEVELPKEYYIEEWNRMVDAMKGTCGISHYNIDIEMPEICSEDRERNRLLKETLENIEEDDNKLKEKAYCETGKKLEVEKTKRRHKKTKYNNQKGVIIDDQKKPKRTI
ncbi:hypothetical protein EIN_028580 [Entamoeba invadens IP1]|uniref:Uncharacterized protein n=1 Tax=Entamoeba invadens IP1 TaxID=370355 RepID=L7FLB9_ENTIV|nr:hypothetical protein EIN_028580 [Entamoeba invadens IP1]ELP87073.1 hypothetical protein EIN_028580 [Entamoeba invadens IP1]|eukprot:XP_004253844.1 hypothetical protein EIN_028580 [Entamoeba invadens IP1]